MRRTGRKVQEIMGAAKLNDRVQDIGIFAVVTLLIFPGL